MSKKKPRRDCLNCGEACDRPEKFYCDNICQHDYAYKSWIKKWLAGRQRGWTAWGGVSCHIHRWLREKFGDKCGECGWKKVHPITKKVPVEVDHKDGNWKNCSPKNLRLVCPNCHSLTSTFKNLNKGRGRKKRLEPIG